VRCRERSAEAYARVNGTALLLPRRRFPELYRKRRESRKPPCVAHAFSVPRRRRLRGNAALRPDVHSARRRAAMRLSLRNGSAAAICITCYSTKRSVCSAWLCRQRGPRARIGSWQHRRSRTANRVSENGQDGSFSRRSASSTQSCPGRQKSALEWRRRNLGGTTAAVPHTINVITLKQRNIEPQGVLRKDSPKRGCERPMRPREIGRASRLRGGESPWSYCILARAKRADGAAEQATPRV
jgi:hypothetical protein